MMVHVQAHVGLLVSLLDSAAPDLLRHRVASAAAEGAGFAAWLWYDLGDLYTMSHCYRQATLTADESSNTGLRSYILGYQGLVARTQGHLESALGFFDQARQTAQRSVSNPTLSWLTVLTADALARVGRSREALAELDAALSLLSGQDSRTDEWMYDSMRAVSPSMPVRACSRWGGRRARRRRSPTRSGCCLFPASVAAQRSKWGLRPHGWRRERWRRGNGWRWSLWRLSLLGVRLRVCIGSGSCGGNFEPEVTSVPLRQ